MLLTVASPAGPQHYNKMNLAAMAPNLDFFNLMAFDYAGMWDAVSGHQANLYPSTGNPRSTPFSTDTAVKDYLKAGVPAHKIVVGMPLYGRAFQQTDGIGTPFQGVGKGSIQDGIWDYHALPQAGAVEQMDEQAGGSYSWDEAKRIVVSYDNVAASDLKIDYIKKNRLGGSMFWKLGGDRKANGSLIMNVSFHQACHLYGRALTESIDVP